jgi:alkylresorcinol/alkylpyrone synthase
MPASGAKPTILAARCALPPHYASQEQIIAALRREWGREHYNLDRLEDLHRAVQVGGRYLALPLAAYRELTSFAARNAAWLEAALDLGERAIADGLTQAGLRTGDVDHLLVATTTGIATPSLDARLCNRLGLRADVRRTPIFGLGCAGGAGGLGRAADHLQGHPDQISVLLSVEVCSLTLQREDLSIPNIIASGLFGDGAGAVVIAGAERARQLRPDGRAGPRILASGSMLYRDTERVMGWEIVDSGFKVLLSASVPEVVRTHIRGDVDRFLSANGLERGRIDHWLAHTGGPRVLEAFASALELGPESLACSWRSLAEVGNLSAASVLFVLADLLAENSARPGQLGLLAAMGPGFGSELVLLGW